MAQKSKKDRAKRNVNTLNNLHLATFCVNLFFFIFVHFFRKRSIIAYFIFSMPCLLAEFVLEKTGRPKYDATSKALKTSGEDLSAPGLTDFMFDVIFVTWISLVCVMIFGNWGWLFWMTIPIFGLYKGFKLFGVTKEIFNSPVADQNTSTSGNKTQRKAGK